MTEQSGVDVTEECLRGWLLRGLVGDAPAYHDFLKAASVHLRAYFRRRLSRLPDDVEDLVQETLLAMHNQRQTYDVGLPLTAWMYGIARYKLVDLLRRRAVRELLTDPLDDDDARFLSSADSEAAEARRDLGKLLDRLPERHRLPIVHTKIEGRSVAETARLTGQSESAVKVGVHRGLKALAAMIRAEQRDEP